MLYDLFGLCVQHELNMWRVQLRDVWFMICITKRKIIYEIVTQPKIVFMCILDRISKYLNLKKDFYIVFCISFMFKLIFITPRYDINKSGSTIFEICGKITDNDDFLW